MAIDLAIALREYCIEKKITSPSEQRQIIISYRGRTATQECVFDVYRTYTDRPEVWVLKRFDTSKWNGYKFPSDIEPTAIAIAMVINSQTGLGIRPEEIAGISRMEAGKVIVIISTDSMYFSNQFYLSL